MPDKPHRESPYTVAQQKANLPPYSSLFRAIALDFEKSQVIPAFLNQKYSG